SFFGVLLGALAAGLLSAIMSANWTAAGAVATTLSAIGVLAAVIVALLPQVLAHKTERKKAAVLRRLLADHLMELRFLLTFGKSDSQALPLLVSTDMNDAIAAVARLMPDAHILDARTFDRVNVLFGRLLRVRFVGGFPAGD